LQDKISETTILDYLNEGEREKIISSSYKRKSPQPFVKWAGGKRSIINDLLDNKPNEFNHYFEPFVGGGALFFTLYDRKEITKATISDINLDLILTYSVIQKDPEILVEKLQVHKDNNNKEYFYKIRKQHDIKNPIEKAARFLYLNKTCYNGLFRVNQKGEFNVPFGKYSNPNIVDKNNIFACNHALRGIDIQLGDFNKIKPKKGDFVYFDPPYHPTKSDSFTSYTKLDFREEDQRKLKDLANKLSSKGVQIMLSNSNTEFIKELYKDDFDIITVKAPRMVNCKSDERIPVMELLIKNY